MNKSLPKWRYALIWLCCLLPMVVAWLMAYTGIGLPLTTRNNGLLMPPGIQVPQSLSSHQNGKWGLLIISNDCGSACQQQLHRMQQIHKSLPKLHDRIQTFWYSTLPPAQLSSVTALEIPIHSIHNSSVNNWAKQQQLAWQDHSIWLIDPNGILVMQFQPQLNGKQIRSDIKWLLKASRIG